MQRNIPSLHLRLTSGHVHQETVPITKGYPTTANNEPGYGQWLGVRSSQEYVHSPQLLFIQAIQECQDIFLTQTQHRFQSQKRKQFAKINTLCLLATYFEHNFLTGPVIGQKTSYKITGSHVYQHLMPSVIFCHRRSTVTSLCASAAETSGHTALCWQHGVTTGASQPWQRWTIWVSTLMWWEVIIITVLLYFLQ